MLKKFKKIVNLIKMKFRYNQINGVLQVLFDENIEIGKGRFVQRIKFWNKGKIIIGEKFVIGYKYGGGYEGRITEIQTRTNEAEIKIGDNLATNNGMFLCARKKIEIGDNCLIGSNVTVMDHNGHGVSPEKRRNYPGKSREVIIEENVWIGNNVHILSGTKIGKNSIVGVGSVVKGEFPENVIIQGNPAKIMKKIEG